MAAMAAAARAWPQRRRPEARDAEAALERRLAAGEIGQAEYRERMAVIGGSRPMCPGVARMRPAR